jgi:hypothetical protein
MMMETANARQRNHLASLDQFDRPGYGRFFVQRQVIAAGVIIMERVAKNPAQVLLVRGCWKIPWRAS